jgi:homopolymeric O-antigen transport system ATP-binding protein
LFNGDGIHVFSSLSNREPNWHGRSFPAGVFRSTCHVPGKLLPEGCFEVSVLVWANNYSNPHREDSVVEFEMHESIEARADYFGGWEGVVRPILDWDTQLLDGPERMPVTAPASA